jgi:cell division protein FtsI/penicillin-binding protein 2
MRSPRLQVSTCAVAGLAFASLTLACRSRQPPPVAPPPATEQTPPLAVTAVPVAHEDTPPPPSHESDAHALAGLDLLRMATDDGERVTAPTDAGTATLTVDADLQQTARRLMEARHLPEAAVVLMDVATGKLLVYASHVDKGKPRDLCTEATAPSASVFKVVTSAALIEEAHLTPDTRECYSGGEQRITAADLAPDPQRDRWCTTLAGALGRSINTVFARLAKDHLSPGQLEAMARRFGYGESPAFDVPVQPSGLHIPNEPLEFARTAAGFWNTTLSPLQAVEISAIVARGGETVHAAIVDQVVEKEGTVVDGTSPALPERGRNVKPPAAPAPHRVMSHETAEQLTTMMEHTVSEGTSYHAFRDGRALPFLPGIAVAGKTGTLSSAESQRFFTWFTGFAPAHPAPGVRQVAVAALVVNGPSWQIKANVLARDVLRAYFAAQGAEGVTRPTIKAVARRR